MANKMRAQRQINRRIMAWVFVPLMGCLVLLIGCTQRADLSSPEKNHETFTRAFRTKNYELWLKCLAYEPQVFEEFTASGLDAKTTMLRFFDR